MAEWGWGVPGQWPPELSPAVECSPICKLALQPAMFNTPHKIEAAAHNHAESFCQYQLQDFSLIELYSKFTLSTDSKNHDLYCPWIDWLMMHWFLQKQVFILMLSWVYEFPRVYCEKCRFWLSKNEIHISKELSREDAAVDQQTLTLTKQNEVCFSSPPSYDV